MRSWSRSTSNLPRGDGALQVEPLDRHGPNGYERDPPHATDARTSRHDIKNIRISALRFQAPSSVCSASESNHMKIINVASKTYFPKQGVARVGFLLIFIRITIGIQDVFRRKSPPPSRQSQDFPPSPPPPTQVPVHTKIPIHQYTQYIP